MKNISLDNPIYLFILIPLILLIVIPFAIAIRKDNRSKSVVISLIIHIVIACLVALGLAGTVYTTIMTKTQVIILADVSYSANKNLDKVDSYINTVMEQLPDKSEVGIVCFGKDSQQLTAIGDDVVSVKGHTVDDSATDITQAIRYATELFDEGVIKRIVLITDGKQTDTEGMGALISAVEDLHSKNIAIDAMYLDDNIAAGQHEVQVSGVEYTKSTYLNHESEVNVLLQSNTDTKSIVSLYKKNANGEYVKMDYVETDLVQGYNVVNFNLDTSADGQFEYKVDIFAKDDGSDKNDEYFFTQSVSGKLSVLLVTEKEEDIAEAKKLFGDMAQVDSFFITEKVYNSSLTLDIMKTAESRKENNIYVVSTSRATTKDFHDSLPMTVEEICKYDEIILSNVDVRNLDNFTAFIDTVDKAVSLFGKSLVTMGDTKIQNSTDDILKQLEDMLPVRYGNSDQDKKMLGIVIDVSRSMETVYHLDMAKDAAKQLINLLNPEDYVSIVAFHGDVVVAQAPVQANDVATLEKIIDNLEPKQGTRLDAGLKETFELMRQYTNFENKQVMLISDGRSYAGATATDPVTTAKNMYAEGITISTLFIGNTLSTNEVEVQAYNTMKKIAMGGGGEYYDADRPEDVPELILQEVADDITESVIEKDTPVYINREKDDVLNGINSIPNIGGYLYGKVKSSATTVLYTEFQKGRDENGEGIFVDVPIYAYWNYGKGRVASLMTDMTGEWLDGWIASGTKDVFFDNILDANTPEEKIDYPYTLNVEYDGKYTNIEIVPAILDPSAKVNVEITSPITGEVISNDLIFDSEKYFYSFETPEIGKYDIKVTYSYGSGEEAVSYPSNTFFNLSYSPEYDCFQIFEASALHEAIRSRGTVSEDGSIKLENDENMIDTYVVDFTMPFLIAAASLYVIDVIIRKLKWSDIKNLFKKKKS